MSGMTDLAAWLLAQYDADEQVARAATPPPWVVTGSDVDPPLRYVESYADEALPVVVVGRYDGMPADDDLAAKRRIIELHRRAKFTNVDLDIRDADVCLICHSVLDEPDDWPEDQEWPYPLVQDAYPCLTVRLLALPYADRDGYRQDWRP